VPCLTMVKNPLILSWIQMLIRIISNLCSTLTISNIDRAEFFLIERDVKCASWHLNVDIECVLLFQGASGRAFPADGPLFSCL